MIAGAAAVEDDPGDALCLGPRGDELADLGGRGDIAGALGTQLRLDGRRRGERPARHVIDHLGDDVLVRTEDRQARALGGAGHLAAHPCVAPLFQGVDSGCVRHDYFPAFPALRRTTSPA